MRLLEFKCYIISGEHNGPTAFERIPRSELKFVCADDDWHSHGMLAMEGFRHPSLLEVAKRAGGTVTITIEDDKPPSRMRDPLFSEHERTLGVP